MRTAKAQIDWLLQKKEIPSTSKKDGDNWIYSPIIVFKNQYNCFIWKENISTVPLWTAIVHNEQINGKKSISTIRYSVNDAPQELIQINATFELYDGQIKVAKGKIIEIISEK